MCSERKHIALELRRELPGHEILESIDAHGQTEARSGPVKRCDCWTPASVANPANPANLANPTFMKIIVTGSIAFDYLMSFPGRFTEHFLPEHMQRVSLSFLVDSMDKRRGGCAPNIAYTLALLGERPTIMATAGEDFGEYRQWLESAGVDTSQVKEVDGKFCASFFCSTDSENNQIASFYTGAMADAGQLSFRSVGECRLAIIAPNDPGAMIQYAQECRTLEDSVHLRPRAAVRAHVGRRAAGWRPRRDDRHRQRLRTRAAQAEDGADRGGSDRALPRR